MVAYKLVYFDLPGRAEIARLLFAAAKQEFEDCRITHADWAQLKPTTVFGQLPVLHVDGKQLAQSNAIARYLARTFKMAGADDWEAAQCDMLVDGIWDVNNASARWWAEKDPAKKAEIWKELVSEKVLPFLEKFTGLLGDKDYFVGGKLTWADLTMFCAFTFWTANSDLPAKFPALAAFSAKVAATPGIAEYLAKQKAK